MTPARPAPPEGVTWFVPCELKNYANHGGHWTGKAGYHRRLREQTQVVVLQNRWEYAWPHLAPRDPKSVSLEVRTWNLFDEHDGLRNACKPIIDGLVRAGVIHSDAPACGHQFLYTQLIDRKQRGVLITVTPSGRARP